MNQAFCLQRRYHEYFVEYSMILLLNVLKNIDEFKFKIGTLARGAELFNL